jgi:hypothetical protein
MIFKGAYGSFGGIAAVDIRWRKLGINVVIGQVLEQGSGCFIVQAVELGFETTGQKKLMA